MSVAGPQNGFGIYVHWPYCARICPYCDFNVYAAKQRDIRPLINAILADLAGHAAQLANHPPATSLYLGGGTPSLIPPADLARLVDTARNLFRLAPDGEITLEANPNDVLAGDLDSWYDAGINRLSIGVQSLDDSALRHLGRDHDSDTARRAITRAGAVFANFSIDLIYARPGQTLPAWQRELDAALAFSPPHLSLYELTISDGTAFAQAVQRGTLVPLDEDLQADLYLLTDETTTAHGLAAYEVSNHARSIAHRAHHNLTYWRSGDWVGVGPGAHGRLTYDARRIATEAARRPADYIQAVAARGIGWASQETISLRDQVVEALTMGLRSIDGVDPSPIEALQGFPLSPQALAEFHEAGLVYPTADGRLCLSRHGRLLADHIGGALLENPTPNTLE